MPAVKAALLCLLLGGSAIGYVYQKNQLAEIGRQIERCDKQYRTLRENNAQLERTLVMAKTLPALEDRVKKLNLGLVAPAQSQILTILEVPATPASKSQPLDIERSGPGIAALK